MVAWKAARVLVGSFVFAAIAPWTSGASVARAQTCEKNEDCPQGFSCHEEQSASDCPPVAACDAGAGAKDCATPAACGESIVTHACRPASCETNADCGGSMVCYERKSTECVGGTSAAPCGPNEKCAPAAPAPEMCTQTSEKLCTPRYVLPCQEAADCGAGFTCESDMECSCSGSSGSATDAPRPSEDAGTSTAADAAFAPRPPSEPAVDGGVAPDAGTKDGGVDGGGGGQAPACECHTLASKHCALQTTKCQGDSECPSDFACVTYAGGSVDCAASKDADAAVCGAALPTEDVKMCAPRYDWGGWSGARDAEDSGHYASGPVSGGDKSGMTSGKSEPPVAAGGSDAGVSADDAGAAMTADNASACSVAAPGARTGSAGVLVGFALLTLGAGGRRRARRLQR